MPEKKPKHLCFLINFKNLHGKILSKNHPTIPCRLNYNKPVEHSDPMFPPTFEFSVYEAEDEEDDDIPYEITRLLEQEEKTIQPH